MIFTVKRAGHVSGGPCKKGSSHTVEGILYLFCSSSFAAQELMIQATEDFLCDIIQWEMEDALHDSWSSLRLVLCVQKHLFTCHETDVPMFAYTGGLDKARMVYITGMTIWANPGLQDLPERRKLARPWWGDSVGDLVAGVGTPVSDQFIAFLSLAALRCSCNPFLEPFRRGKDMEAHKDTHRLRRNYLCSLICDDCSAFHACNYSVHLAP